MAVSQSSPLSALDLDAPKPEECSIRLPHDIGFGAVSSGGLVASVVTKLATKYATAHASISQQTDVRSSYLSFFRPIIPERGPVRMRVAKLSIGKGWSTLRVTVFQSTSKLCASADVVLTSFAILGITLDTTWRPQLKAPAPFLEQLESDSDPNWTSYHTAFDPNGFRRGHAYIKTFLPTSWDPATAHVEQWVTPGWDCLPQGSRDSSQPEARWTNDLLPFVADMHSPVQENSMPLNEARQPSLGSIAATQGFAAAQKQARDQGREDWRRIDGDGAIEFKSETVHVTLTMGWEVKRKLPAEGVRFLFLQAEAKSIIDGRMDLGIRILEERLDLVLVAWQVAIVTPAMNKHARAGRASL